MPVSNWATILFQQPEPIQVLAACEIEIANLGFTTLSLLPELAGADTVAGNDEAADLTICDLPARRADSVGN